MLTCTLSMARSNVTTLKQGRFVGRDQHGNEYYENYDYQHLQQRWVKFKEEYSYNACQVPPEWHAWMHYLSDGAPHNADMPQPKAYLPTDEEGWNKTGTPRQYFSKGNWKNPKGAHHKEKWGTRSWRRYDAWQPSNHSLQ